MKRSVRLLALIAIAFASATAVQVAAQGGGDGGRASEPPPGEPGATAQPSRSVQNVGPQCITYSTINVPIVVPEPPFTAGTVNSTIIVPHNFVLTDVDLGPLNIDHTFVQDLEARLYGPGGTGVVLFQHIGGPIQAANISDLVLDDSAASPIGSAVAPFTGTYSPDGALSSFNGQSSFGQWRLEITDTQFLDTGTLTSWSLRLCGFLGTTHVVPDELADTEGNVENRYPFHMKTDGTSIRYQQVFGSSELPSYPVRITQIAFRPDETFGQAFSRGGLDVEIRLAHTDSSANGLIEQFDSNLDRDVTFVYDGPLYVSSANTGAGPRDFDIVIGLHQTFVYNGQDNLLMEVRIIGQPYTTFFDASNSSSDNTSRVYAFNSNASIADPAQSPFFAWGLVTQFTTDVDTDSDSCVDAREVGSTATLGGARDSKVFWDFFDTPDANNTRDAVVSAGDILRLVGRFGTNGDPRIDPLSAPPASGYHTAFDRSPPTGDPWDLGPPDGSIAANDILFEVNQFGHSCSL